MQHNSSTTIFKITYALAMTLIIMSVIGGAWWMEQSAAMESGAIMAMLKRPVYAAQLYSQSGILSAGPFQTESTQTSSGKARAIPVLVYHGIVKEPDGSTINITEVQFKEHMFALKQAGYESVTLSELSDFLRGKKTLPEKSVAITFDDGRADSFYNGDAILATVGYHASMFAIGKYTEFAKMGGYYLSSPELLRMEQSPVWEIGSHSYDAHNEITLDAMGEGSAHFYSGREWIEEKQRQETVEEFTKRISDDLTRSQTYFSEILGRPVMDIALPFGDFGQHIDDSEPIEEIVTRTVRGYFDLIFYQAAPGEYFSQAYPPPNVPDTLGVMVHRINMTNELSGTELLSLLSAGTPKQIPYTARLTQSEGWVSAWGSMTFRDATLTLDSQEKLSGAATVLDGTGDWTDYEVEAEVTSGDGASVVLWVRYGNNDRNAACNFGNDFIHIDQSIDGEERVIRGVRGTGPIPEEPFTVAARIEGRTLTCYRNGEAIVETEFLDPALVQGGIGFRTWSPAGNATLVIHSLLVTPLNSASRENAQPSDETDGPQL